MKRGKKEEAKVLFGVAVISFISAVSSFLRLPSGGEGGYSRGLFGSLEQLLIAIFGPYAVPTVMLVFGVFSLVLAFFSWRE